MPKDKKATRPRRLAASSPGSALAYGNFELLKLDRLAPDPSNPRRHSPQQIAAIASSIEAFGFNAPILVDGKTGLSQDMAALRRQSGSGSKPSPSSGLSI
ncbi:hypothetical protein CR492_20105 [Methylocella silvestris]|uniref:Uncharacterized protein n=1 Tax=Methylocella silvestris TaxID=199596 RepID=A0A2J7TBQ1_METSI|nr:hypothetical protein CR492_20105 [Methylocella silvestris]